MMRKVYNVLLIAMFSSIGGVAAAFSLNGPFADWQVFRIGYQVPGLEVGGPMNLTEEYRWNIKKVTYGFDKTFIDYFGARGVAEVNKAFAILNALPRVSKMRSDLSEFPTDTRRVNSRAAALNLIDLKSAALGIMMEQMGLTDPERFSWALRSRATPAPGIITYSVIMRNFDPITWAPTAYVNGTLYTYTIIDAYWAADSSDAVESTVDPLAPTGTAVASFLDSGAVYGQYYTGLTRDDVGGLRYILHPKNYNYETLLSDTLPGSNRGPWTPVGSGTNVQSTNLLINLALRPGVDKIIFKQMKNDSRVGYLRAITNRYTDTYILNGRKRTQRTERVLSGGITNSIVDAGVPDILFTAGDIGVDPDIGYPFLYARTTTAGWANNSAINTQGGFGLNAGPGVIQPPIIITFNNVGPFNFHESPGFVDEEHILESGFVWGSFDGTTNAPIVYPDRVSIETLENMVLNGGF